MSAGAITQGNSEDVLNLASTRPLGWKLVTKLTLTGTWDKRAMMASNCDSGTLSSMAENADNSGCVSNRPVTYVRIGSDELSYSGGKLSKYKLICTSVGTLCMVVDALMTNMASGPQTMSVIARNAKPPSEYLASQPFFVPRWSGLFRSYVRLH